MKTPCEYIWLDANQNFRSKTKVLDSNTIGPPTIDKFPTWNYDGSSTFQAEGLNSELILKPVAVYTDPFRTHGFLVLCETYDKNMNPLPSNTRHNANELFNKNLDSKPWFGIEQEYFITNSEVRKYVLSNKIEQGQYYCSIGTGNAYFREIAEEHLQHCIKAGLNISGINAEVAPCQWEYQIGPCVGINSGDEMQISRYILIKLGEKYDAKIDFSPKPYKNINGSGCHTNFSTEKMRNENGLEEIYNAIEKLSKKHMEHMKVYGDDNDQRMSGLYETAKFDKFSFNRERSVDRGASVRVGYETINNKCGYFEDRRPASNMDPYLVTSKIFETTVLNSPVSKSTPTSLVKEIYTDIHNEFKLV